MKTWEDTIAEILKLRAMLVRYEALEQDAMVRDLREAAMSWHKQILITRRLLLEELKVLEEKSK